MASRVEKEVSSLLEPLVCELGLDLVQVQYSREGGRWILRLFIDRDGGVGLDDCSLVSQRVELVLDLHDPIPHRYTLEVSSPGVERPIRGEKDIHRFQGQKVQVRAYAPVRGRKKWGGRLLGLEQGQLWLEVDGDRLAIPWEQVARISLAPDLPW